MLNFLKGYKSILGVIGSIATFVVVVTGCLQDGFQMSDVQLIMGGLSALLLAIGWTGKLVNLEKGVKK